MRVPIYKLTNLQTGKLWLLIIAGLLISFHLHFAWQAGLTNLVVTTILFTTAIYLRIQKRFVDLRLESDRTSQILALTIIMVILLKSLFWENSEYVIRLLPLIIGFTLAILASGIKGIKQYWLELILLLLLAIPLEALIEPINQTFQITTLLAQFSTFILWYLGFDVTRQGEFIILPTKATWVGPNCSGVLTILWMLQLGLLFLVMFPTKPIHKILVPVAAIAIVIFINGIRIAIMSYMAAHNYALFEILHSDKAQIFSTIPLLLFAAFCKFLHQQQLEKSSLIKTE
ncbi:cyanoexosortase A [[Phormidium ambiguum] IAM M-71]|uniref:Cyanoexosortase A n=1 Tax=[Phormidium ambiguum] IAM M-71 TaxID=454136 RepID=A0A1U7IPX2_9CYAN|nr:cyanoexosortase A [Phormidium ambiguum]OKH39374.1 cyanoexosortase A [Phormidium ambiguum IAM M-71]